MGEPSVHAADNSQRVGLFAFSLQLLLGSTAIALGIITGFPRAGLAGLGLAAAFGAVVCRRGVSSRSDLVGWWSGSLLVLASLVLWGNSTEVAAISRPVFVNLLAAMGLAVGARLGNPAAKARWRWTGLAWALPGLALLVGSSYLRNLPLPFYLGILLSIALLTGCKRWYRLPAVLVQAVNTLILISVGLLALGLVQRKTPEQRLAPLPAKAYYRFAVAQKDPAGFRRWWSLYAAQWARMIPALFEMHPGAPLFYRPRPGHQTMFFNSRVVLNSLGFRGAELAQPKGNTYRIVALGESTTFGSTVNAGDKPWPELLQQMIRERLKPSRPVEVVNAGTPSFGLTNNLRRLPTEILPLKPDLLISYHGYNGFGLLYGVSPKEQALYPPVHAARPLKLLADCDYRLRVLWYRYRRGRQRLDPAVAGAVMQTEYARAYRELIGLARTNGFHLALANYSMAVNARSEPAVIDFFQTGFPDAPVSIQANEVHSLLVRRLCEENPDVIFVDTHPGLDGEHDLFLDLMHFTEAGDRRLAETMFQALKPTLEQDFLGWQSH